VIYIASNSQKRIRAHGEDQVILAGFILKQYQRVTDRQTGGQAQLRL